MKRKLAATLSYSSSSSDDEEEQHQQQQFYNTDSDDDENAIESNDVNDDHHDFMNDDNDSDSDDDNDDIENGDENDDVHAVVQKSNDSSSDSSDSSSDSSDDSDSDDDDEPTQLAFTIAEDISDDVIDAKAQYEKGDSGMNSDDDDDENGNGGDDEQDSDEEDEQMIDRIISSRNNSNSGDGNSGGSTHNSSDDDNSNSGLLLVGPIMSDHVRRLMEQVEVKEPRFVKPFDYDQLRSEQSSRGVIFVQKPFGLDLINRFSTPEAIRRFFVEFGTITRVAPEYEFRNRKRHLVGFYVEYEDKNIAKRVALSVNGAPISRRDSRTLSVKYIPRFDWASIGEHEERKKLYQKMLRLEAEKELRLVKGYRRNLKMAERQKDDPQQQFHKTNFKFKQHRFDRYTMDKNHHLNFLPIFGGEGEDNDNSKSGATTTTTNNKKK